MAERASIVRDPQLFLVLAFVAWTPRELPAESAARMGDIVHTLEALEWLPADKRPLPRLERTEDVADRLWITDPAPPHRTRADWSVYYYGYQYHETLVIYLGVQQNGDHVALIDGSPLAWIESAVNVWCEQFGGPDAWTPRITLPHIGPDHAGPQPRVVSQAWIWTGEQEPPDDGWSVFAKGLYAPLAGTRSGVVDDGYAAMPWGALGVRTRGADGLPIMLLHGTTTDTRPRDLFLFRNLAVISTELGKSLQFRWVQYTRYQRPALQAVSRELEIAIESQDDPLVRQPLPVRDVATSHLSHLLFEISKRLVDLKDLEHSLSISVDTIGEYLSESTTLQPRVLAKDVSRRRKQIASDIAYFENMENRGRIALEAQRTAGVITLARIGHLITLLTIAISVFLGSAPLLSQLLNPAPGAPGAAQGPTELLRPILVSLVLAVAAALLAFWWFFGRHSRRP